MVSYIRSDLDFILAQIKIAESHALYIDSNGVDGQPLFGPGGSVPAYTLSYGLRTVDGRYNNLLPGQQEWGAAEIQFPTLLDPVYRPATPVVLGPPGTPSTASSYDPMYKPGASPQDATALVIDPALRTISNLIVDQTLGNPAAILTALDRAGSANSMADLPLVTAVYETFKPAWDAEYDTRVVLQTAQAKVDALSVNPAATQEQKDAAQLELQNAQAAHQGAVDDLEAARVVRDAALEPFGITMDGDNVHLPNVAPDVGLSAPFNSWFTLFGQFFDHGLDLVNKGGSGTVYIPLQPDDPLYVPGSQTNFMVLTRATVLPGQDGLIGTEDDVRPVNTTTSFVDQNQTYTSHASHQVFLRQYVLGTDGEPHATGKLIEGGGAQPGGMATWGEVKAQAKAVLGIELTDFDVGAVPLLRTDPYGNFIPFNNPADATDPRNGFPQLIIGVGPDGIPNTGDDIVVSGTASAPINPSSDFTVNGVTYSGALRTPMAFLADIAHEAVPVGKIEDGDITIGLANPGNGSTEYDDELLDAHFIAGDGRANENIGLTAVHHIFHSEHNRLVEHTKEMVLASKDLVFINEWLTTDITQAQVNDIPATLPTDPIALATLLNSFNWDGERLFQAAKFGTEMQYQHLVFEDFARKIQPAIDFFVVPDGYHADINPSIVAEFAHVVYRFGHSMLTETIDRINPAFTNDPIGLIEAFLNPIEFDSGHTIADNIAAGDIIRGMTRQVGNEIDEFVTSALRNNLLGLPLDLATINLARGRDTGVPSLNAARRDFYEASSHAPELKPYTSWVDFAGNLKHEASIINFIAAYGNHSLITGESTTAGKRDAALTLITGTGVGKFATPEFIMPNDAVDFLNGTGAYAVGGSLGALGGLDNVDLWIGGLAEKIMPFGGMLGSTFNFVFEVQLEKLQDGDRFYYLQRLDGLHLLSEMENNTFAKLILKNADAGHLPSDVFSTPGLILEVDQTKQWNPGLADTDPSGGGLLTPLVNRDNPDTPGVDTNYLKYSGPEHVLLGGSSADDILIASEGDDSLYGDAGRDRLEGGYGNDQYIGGDGDDIITDIGGDDIIRSGAGNDAINAGLGTDLVVAEAGNDFIVLGADMLDEAFGGVGNDFIMGSKTTEQSMGGEGDDWIEVGAWTGAVGDNFDDQFAADAVTGHDVFHGDGGFDEFIGEGGDDIWFGSLGRGKFDGMSGFDWATYAEMPFGVNADLFRQHFDALPLPPPDAALDEYSFVEGVSGSKFADQIHGSDVTAADMPSEGARGSVLNAAGIALIKDLQAVLGAGVTTFAGGNILLGGAGSDLIEGRGGDDIIDGDKWLNVRIAVHQSIGPDGGVGPLLPGYENVDSMKDLVDAIFSGTINPGQLRIVREILTVDGTGDVDTALYRGARSDYAFSATADGQVIVTDATELNLDGSDKLRNIEKVQFATGNALNIIVGTPFNDNGGTGTNDRPVINGTANDDLILGLAGNDVLNGFAGNDILVGGPGVDTLNGGLGDDTYSFAIGDGNDVINEGVSGTSGGSADLISILAPTTGIDLATNLPIRTLTALNANDSNTGTQQGDLVINYTMSTGTAQTVTVAGHFNGTSAGTGVERINFNNAAYQGYLLGAEDYLISRLDPNNRDGGGVNLSTSAANNFIVGENGVNDDITGGLGNDLIFGGTGDNDLIGGDGDDLLVGGSGNGDDDLLDGGLGADTMVGLAGNDDYVVDDLLDVVVEAAGAGTDEVLTEMAALSIEAMANVENLTYTGIDADQFVGTGNSGNNVVSGGDLADTLSGLAGNDTLIGGLGTDTMIGGDGSDIYDVDDAGDEVTETNADLATGGTDRVESDISYALGANVENLDLNGTAVTGTGNALNNVINGNDEDNQLFGGAGNDTLNGNDGNDLLDGGSGDDTITGGNNNDTIIGGDGNDTIDVGGGVNTLVYNSTNFSNDTVLSFDSVGGTAATQDLIDLRALGVTAANFATRVTIADIEDGTTDDTLITVRDASNAVIGTIRLEELEATGANGVTAADFVLAAAAPAAFGAPTAGADTITGDGVANTINGLGGNDTLNGAGGDDVVNGGEGADTLNGGDGNDTLSGGVGSSTGTYADNFDTQSLANSTGSLAWTSSWVETNDSAGVNGGQIRIDDGNNVLRVFGGATSNGAEITRTMDLAGATSATIAYSANPDGLDAGETVTVLFAANGSTFVPLQTISGDGAAVNYTHNITGPFAANAAIRFVSSAISATNEIVSIDNLVVTFSAPTNNTGVDTINGGAGDDTIIWNANPVGAATDGRDLVNGGTEGGSGDTFVINGNATAETYNIYTREAWLALGGGRSAAAATEIVVTRSIAVGDPTNANIIAELTEIEEIRINSVDPSGTTGTAGGDAFNIIGDFSSTNLRPNTITIDGAAGDDTVDISALTSAHRIVFRSNGGNDTIIGNLRPEDVIELPNGATLADYIETVVNGVTTLTKGTHSITYTAIGSGPQVGDDDEDEDDDHDSDDHDSDDDDHQGDGDHDEDDDHDSHDGDDDDHHYHDDALGGDGPDVLRGDAGGNFLSGQGGRDMMFGLDGDDDMLGGGGADMIYGDGGRDRIFGDGGDDLIDAGAGDDHAQGGAGNDLFLASQGDGNDTYWGDDLAGGCGSGGSDTLDMAAITANITVDLGTGFQGRGSASSSQSGTDVLWGIENVVTGAGDDTITASKSVNVMDGGGGNDTFRFLSSADADGDTILGFQPGDKIDLSGIDADSGSSNHTFTLVTGSGFNAAGALKITHESQDGEDYTLVQGNTDGGSDAEFKVSIKGHHNLTNDDFNL